MNYNYLLIYKRNIKVSLLAKNGVWSFKLSGIDWSIPDFMERLYACLIFGEKCTSEIASTLRANYKQITPAEIDDFISHFVDTHTTEGVECNLNDIPVYATEEKPLYIPNPFSYTVTISIKQETELLEIVKESPDSAFQRIQQWFDWYIKQYDLRPRVKRDISTQSHELCIQFCRQHGIKLIDQSPKKPIVNDSYSIFTHPHAIRNASIAIIYIIVAVMLMLYGNKITQPFFLGTILTTIGWLMIGVPLYYVFNNKNSIK